MVLRYKQDRWQCSAVMEHEDAQLLARVMQMQREAGTYAMEAAALVWAESGKDEDMATFSQLVLDQCVLPSSMNKTAKPELVSKVTQNKPNSTTLHLNVDGHNNVTFQLFNDKEKRYINLNVDHDSRVDKQQGLATKQEVSEMKTAANIVKPSSILTISSPAEPTEKKNRSVRFSFAENVYYPPDSGVHQIYRSDAPSECSTENDEKIQHTKETTCDPKVAALAKKLCQVIEALSQSHINCEFENSLVSKLNEIERAVERQCSPSVLQVIAEDVLALQRRAQLGHCEAQCETPTGRGGCDSGELDEVTQPAQHGGELSPAVAHSTPGSSKHPRDTRIPIEHVVQRTVAALRMFLDTHVSTEDNAFQIMSHLTDVLQNALEQKDEIKIENAVTYINNLLLSQLQPNESSQKLK